MAGRTIAITVAAILVIGGGIGAAVALSSGKHHGSASTSTSSAIPATTSAPASTLSPSTSLSPPTSGTSSGGSSSLAGQLPFSQCQDVPANRRGIPGATDEVICLGSDVTSADATAVFYASYSSPAQATAYLQALAGNATTHGDCSGIQLGSGEALCTFQDTDSSAGSAVLFLGSSFTFGPNGADTTNNCPAFGQSGTNGASTLVWNYSGSPVVGGMFACSASTAALQQMRAGLLAGDYRLSNQ